jgi:hypothetical protein
MQKRKRTAVPHVPSSRRDTEGLMSVVTWGCSRYPGDAVPGARGACSDRAAVELAVRQIVDRSRLNPIKTDTCRATASRTPNTTLVAGGDHD